MQDQVAWTRCPDPVERANWRLFPLLTKKSHAEKVTATGNTGHAPVLY
jgi:hypothetical protein